MRPETHITHTSSSRPTGGIFISAIFPGEIRAELTTVNKPTVINYESTSCKHPTFPAVKHGDAPVNKISTVLSKISPLTTHYSRLIIALAHCRIAALFDCQFVERQRLRRDILSPFCRWQGFCNYLCG